MPIDTTDRPPDAGTSPDDPERDDVLAVYLGTFAPRRDLHNRWDPRTGHYVIPKDHTRGPGCTGRDDDECPTSPLTTAVVWDAFRGRYPVGAYHPGADGRTNVGVVDLDRDDGMDVARTLARTLGATGIPAYIEPSAGGRAHLWATGPLLPAQVWTFALLAGLAAAGYDAPDPTTLDRVHHIEVRPDGSGGYGRAMRLPGMWHPKTGKRYPMLAPDGSPLGRTVREWLLAVDDAPAANVVYLAEAHRRPEPIPARSWSRTERDFARAVGVTQVLAALGLTNAAPGRTVRCPLHDDRRASLTIARDDRRVWCKSAGCVAYGPDGKGLGAADLALAVRGAVA